MIEGKSIPAKWSVSIFINVIVLVAYFLCTDLTYESNDDYSIATKMVSDGFPNVSFVNYYLCKLISFFQINFLSTTNGFVLSQILFSFMSLTILTYVFLSTRRGRVFSLFTIVVLVIYAYDHYTMVQFTKTSALMMTAGVIIIVHVFINKTNPLISIVGVVLFLMGSMYRFSNTYAVLMIAIAFVAIFFFRWMLSNRSKKRTRQLRSEKKKEKAVFLGIIVCFILCLFGALILRDISISMNESSDDLEEYRKYSAYRARVADYPIPAYADNKEFYDSLSISENDLYVMKSQRYYDYDGVAKLENLKLISEKQKIDNKEKSVKASIEDFKEMIYLSMKDLTNRGVHIILVVILVLLGALFYEKGWLLYPIAICGIAIIGYIYLFYIGRVPYRASYVIDISTTVLLLYSYRTVEPRGFTIKLLTMQRMATFISVLLITVMLSIFSANLLHANYKVRGNERLNSDELWNYMRENEDILFVFDLSTSTGLYKYNLTEYLNPLYLNPPSKKNQVSFGGWSTNSPYQKKTLRQYGLNNIYEDIIDRDDVIVVSNNAGSDSYGNQVYKREVVQYFNEEYSEYGNRIQFIPVDNVGGFILWKVKTVPSYTVY